MADTKFVYPNRVNALKVSPSQICAYDRRIGRMFKSGKQLHVSRAKHCHLHDGGIHTWSEDDMFADWLYNGPSWQLIDWEE